MKKGDKIFVASLTTPIYTIENGVSRKVIDALKGQYLGKFKDIVMIGSTPYILLDYDKIRLVRSDSILVQSENPNSYPNTPVVETQTETENLPNEQKKSNLGMNLVLLGLLGLLLLK